jgi:hypothetical protein
MFMTQDEAFDIFAIGQNIFLTGAAGSGKTFLVNRFIRYAHEHGIMIAVTASTGIAATHIGGTTIHSWSGIGIRESLSSEDIAYIMEREYLMKRFAKTSILIIACVTWYTSSESTSLTTPIWRYTGYLGWWFFPTSTSISWYGWIRFWTSSVERIQAYFCSSHHAV